MVTNEGKSCLFLRFKNCTGNLINLTDELIDVDMSDFIIAQLALSIDPMYKKSRSRTVKQAINMVLRWRTISLGYYDYQIKRHVYPMTKQQAAINLELRHKKLTGEDQNIEKKTLDDYYDKIKWGDRVKNPYNFDENQNELTYHLRRHVEETRKLK